MSDLKLSFLERQSRTARARLLLQQLSAAVKSARLYPSEHPQFLATLQALEEALEKSLAAGGAVVFNLSEKELYFGEIALVDDSLAQRQIVKELAAKKIFRLQFQPGVTRDELSAFVRAMAREPLSVEASATELASFQADSFPHVEIKIGQPTFVNASGKGSGVGKANITEEVARKKEAEEIYGEGVRLFSQMLDGIQARRELELEPINAFTQRLSSSAAREERYLLNRAHHGHQGFDLVQHVLNVTILSLGLGKLLGLSLRQLSILAEAAIFHDIGTAVLPPEILAKQDDLTPMEQALFEQHPAEGAALLAGIPGINGISISVALEHHLHCDGSGYPRLEAAAAPHLFSCLVGICDFYDAMASRAESDPLIYPAKIISLMWSKRESHFKAPLLKAFVQMMGVYPVGSVLELTDGRRAVVVANNPDNLRRPRAVLAGTSDPQIAQTIDLGQRDEETGEFKYTIASVLSPPVAHLDVHTFLKA